MSTSKAGHLLSLGTHGMWGFSPSFDLQEGVSELRGDSNQLEADASSTDPLCVLVVSPGDIRHVLTTIARSRRWKKRPLHIYLYEKSPECLARALLLLQVANDWEIPLRQRCNTFLEVFGNALVQERTAEYIEEKAKQLVHLVCNESGHLADIVDLSHLKMKTRDALVEAFQSWHTSVPFNVERLRDQRLRHYYENRYDYRNNLIDWDYTMSLKKIQDASVIHVRQFKEWRNTGVAFEFGDQKYTVPNRTMATYTDAMKKGHGSVSCRGYWLDIVVGPYIAFGVDCFRSNKFADGLFEIHNKGSGCEQNRHNTTEVAVFNVLSHLHEIETGDIYKMKKAHDVYSGIGEIEDGKVRDGPVQEGDATSENNDHDDVLPRFEVLEDADTNAEKTDARKRAQRIVESFDGVKVILLSGPAADLAKKPRYQRKFNHVHVSVHATNLISSPDKDFPITNMCADRAKVSIEASVYLLPFKEDQRVAYMQKLVEFAGALDLQTSKQVFGASDAYKRENAVLKFEYARHPSKQATG
ncbi:hypothetical protein H310_01331 [Aphanomyces invadans]|uniref:Dynein assembly factor 3, axonemal n=1 Tax=Aphanomyces invadans TaxID=157072 RepID=A0A024UR92_9STRA|nr:hypothetical protein H310_01331 [Aphanomyces invadans]ETW08824.1 hypothetical protein H310_01331 [Aphanomyces invadans]|eukprot:XP_008862629.1 hypothetical protein H310_01331 [Aphanomyces invadans]